MHISDGHRQRSGYLQIGLVDMLKEEYGIEPAGMLGHSAGEIPCGYADGCLTREQTILIAYHRGGSVLTMPVICCQLSYWRQGSLAACHRGGSPPIIGGGNVCF